MTQNFTGDACVVHCECNSLTLTRRLEINISMFPKVVERHQLRAVGKQITIRQRTHSVIYVPKIAKSVDVH